MSVVFMGFTLPGEAAAATDEASASIDEMNRTMKGIITVIDGISSEMNKFKVS